MNNETNTWPDAQTLIETLRLKDIRNHKLLVGIQGSTAVIGLFYISFVSINPDNFFSSIEQIANLLLGLGLIISGVNYSLLLRKASTVKYDASTLAVLKQTVKRLQFSSEWSWPSVLAVLLIDAGISMAMYQDRLYYSVVQWTLISQAVVCLIALASFGLHFLLWRRNTKPLRDKTLALIIELEA